MDESRECSSQATETMLITASTKYFIKWYVYVKILSEAQPRTILRIYHDITGTKALPILSQVAAEDNIGNI